MGRGPFILYGSPATEYPGIPDCSARRPVLPSASGLGGSSDWMPDARSPARASLVPLFCHPPVGLWPRLAGLIPRCGLKRGGVLFERSTSSGTAESDWFLLGDRVTSPTPPTAQIGPIERSLRHEGTPCNRVP